MESLLFPLLLAMLALFMYFNIRKQKKRMADMQEMQNSVATGARVQLTSGMYATVVDSSGDFVDLEIAQGVITRFNRLAVTRVVPTEEAAGTYPGALGVAEEFEQIDDKPADDHINPANPTDDK
ncbi:preprotein translocase subunit YajC [Gordonia sp. CPCC 205515]|uniref:preprotein translocase subunit YajC n=1 Tax=Gordonia sp. CPCC 205515 TaxID=3140791 RepID=UPI003AF3C9A6